MRFYRAVIVSSFSFLLAVIAVLNVLNKPGIVSTVMFFGSALLCFVLHLLPATFYRSVLGNRRRNKPSKAINN